MNKKDRFLRIFLSAVTLWTLLLNSIPVRAQGGDIVGSDDISGGSSVFVFRKSRSAPQTKFAARKPPKRNIKQKEESRRKIQIQVAKEPSRRKPIVAKPPPTTMPSVTDEASKVKASDDIAGAGEFFLKLGDVDKSIGYFKQAIQLNPKNDAAKQGLSDAYTKKGDKVYESDGAESALVYYEEAIKFDDKNAPAYAAAGGVYDELERLDAALQAYETALKLNPKLTELYAPLGIALYQKGEVARADDLLTKAVAIQPEDEQTQFLLGVIRYSQQRYDDSIKALNQVLKVNPNSPEAYYYLGEVYDKLGKDNEAIAAYQQATSKNPKYVDAWFDLGAAYNNRKRYEEAINAYKTSVTLKNDNYEAHENLADIYRQIGLDITEKIDKSKNPTELQDLDRLRRKNYQMAEGSYQIAMTLAEREANDPKKKINPQVLADLYSKYGFILGRLFKWEATINILNKAVALNPDAVDYTNLGWAYYNFAQVDMVDKRKADRLADTATARQKDVDAKSKLEKARDSLRKATSLDSRSVGALLNLGVTLSDLGDFKGAIDALRQALSLKNKWLPALNELGLAYRKDGNLNEAANYFRQAVEVDKNFRAGLYNLAEAEHARGNVKEAREVQKKLALIDPNMAKSLEFVFFNSPNQTKQKPD